jgi:hypothetical protein
LEYSPHVPSFTAPPQSFTLEHMNDKPINTCPCCAEVKPLCLLKTADGREWFNAACKPCSMAMDELDRWTFFPYLK